MTKTEYWKMNDSVFIKVSEDGIFKDTKSIPLDEVSKEILSKFEKEGADYFFEDDGNLQAEADTEQLEMSEPIISKVTYDSPTETLSAKDGSTGVDLDKINKDVESVSKEDIENFATSSISKEDTVLDRVLPSGSNVEEENIANFVENLRPEHLGQESIKSETLISNGSFQDEIGSGNIDNYVSSITSNSESTPTVSKEPTDYDFVQAPNHYNGHIIITKGEQEFEYETIEFIEAWLRRHSWMPEEAKYAAGNGLKYYDRVGNKPEGGKSREEKAAEDFEKISWYALRAAKALRGKLYKKD